MTGCLTGGPEPDVDQSLAGLEPSPSATRHAIDTTAGFGKAGTYVLRLTANDGALSSTDDVTVTVQGPANQAPVVDAGPDQTVTLPAHRPGRHRHRRRPARAGRSVTTGWTKVSGPGTVTFGDPAAVDTTASFSGAGTYVLRLSANDGALSSADDITVTVKARTTRPRRQRRAGPHGHAARHGEPGRHRHRRRPPQPPGA